MCAGSSCAGAEGVFAHTHHGCGLLRCARPELKARVRCHRESLDNERGAGSGDTPFTSWAPLQVSNDTSLTGTLRSFHATERPSASLEV